MSVILVTGAGGPAGQALGRQLAGRFPLLGVDMMPQPADRSRWFEQCVVAPAASDPNYLPFLRRLIGDYDVQLVIPTVQEELPVLAPVAHLLGPPVCISDAGPVALAQDKLLTAWHLQAVGVTTPTTRVAGDVDTSRIWPDELPLVVKPRVSRGGRGVTVCDDLPSLRAALDGPGLMVQEFAPGTEYCPQVYRSRNHVRCGVVVLEKTGLKEGRVGNAVGVRRVRDRSGDDVAALAVRTVTAMDLVGPVDLDIRRRADGIPVVLEINARFGANSEAAPELLDQVLMAAGLATRAA